MVIELSGVQFGLKTRDFKIERARSASSIWNHKYDFRPKLYDPKIKCHFIRFILKSHNLIVKFAKQWLYCLSFSCNVIGWFFSVPLSKKMRFSVKDSAFVNKSHRWGPITLQR